VLKVMAVNVTALKNCCIIFIVFNVSLKSQLFRLAE
jgi:hypothetical protein